MSKKEDKFIDICVSLMNKGYWKIRNLEIEEYGDTDEKQYNDDIEYFLEIFGYSKKLEDDIAIIWEKEIQLLAYLLYQLKKYNFIPIYKNYLAKFKKKLLNNNLLSPINKANLFEYFNKKRIFVYPINTLPRLKKYYNLDTFEIKKDKESGEGKNKKIIKPNSLVLKPRSHIPIHNPYQPIKLYKQLVQKAKKSPIKERTILNQVIQSCL